jgi:hypothetical protein
MRAMRMTRTLAYGLPLALFAPDALAWGLQTHLFFAQYALLIAPFADPQLRAAAARLPGLVLAGACLPDLLLAGRALGTPVFSRAHRWSTLRRLSAVPRDDADRALSIGYASHLVTDVVAHNFFVPEHEARLVRVPHATHALAEWAMDDYLRARVGAAPREVLAGDFALVSDFAARAFRCETPLARRALSLLGRADGVLRSSPLPRLCRWIVTLADRQAPARFDTYLQRAIETLPGIEAALSGSFVDWVDSDPEGHSGDQGADARAREHVARIMQAEHHP